MSKCRLGDLCVLMLDSELMVLLNICTVSACNPPHFYDLPPLQLESSFEHLYPNVNEW